eukprot:4296495-Ditylum_brightwellii.AAC.1
MGQKDEEITKLQKSSGNTNNGGNNAGRGRGRNQNRGRGQQQRFHIHYCWMCGVNQIHKGSNCNNKVDGHQDNATLDNCMGGSNHGIAQAGHKRMDTCNHNTTTLKK